MHYLGSNLEPKMLLKVASQRLLALFIEFGKKPKGYDF